MVMKGVSVHLIQESLKTEDFFLCLCFYVLFVLLTPRESKKESPVRNVYSCYKVGSSMLHNIKYIYKWLKNTT